MFFVYVLGVSSKRIIYIPLYQVILIIFYLRDSVYYHVLYCFSPLYLCWCSNDVKTLINLTICFNFSSFCWMLWVSNNSLRLWLNLNILMSFIYKLILFFLIEKRFVIYPQAYFYFIFNNFYWKEINHLVLHVSIQFLKLFRLIQ